MDNDPLVLAARDTRVPGTPPPPEEWRRMTEEERAAYARDHLTPEEWQEARTRFNDALMSLIVYFPFFGFMVSRMAEHRVWLTEPCGVDTMATDGKTLYLWPTFVLYHDRKQLTGFLLHELLHNVLGHIDRGRGYDRELANMAMDYSVNLMVNDAALEAAGLNERMSPEVYRNQGLRWYIPVHPVLHEDLVMRPRFCVDERFRTPEGHPMMWEEIYRILERERQEGGGQGVSRLVDDHEVWRPGQRPGGGQERRPGVSREEMTEWMREALARSRGMIGRSRLPAYLQRTVDDWLRPALPWYTLLQNWMRISYGDYAWAPGDLRFAEPMPALEERPELRYVTLGFDLSGSMQDGQVAASIENARAILRGFPGMQGRAYFWDHEVHQRVDLEEFDGTVRRGISGGGGTSIAPQFAAIREDGIEHLVNVHVCFTDGVVDWRDMDPDRLTHDVLWVITHPDNVPPEHPRYRWTRLETT